MVIEYLMLLFISATILTGAFGLSTGPVKMFKESTPYLAYHVEENLITGEKFISGTSWEQSVYAESFLLGIIKY